MDENKKVARRGGLIANNTRNNIEQELGFTVVSSLNAQDKQALLTNHIEKTVKD